MAKVPELADHHISPTCGFLLEDPKEDLPEYFKPWEHAAKNIATLLEERKLRDVINNMPLLDHTKLRGYREVRLGYTCLCFIANCYVWQNGDKGVVKSLPRQVAIPLTALAGYLGTKPALGYNSLLLANWKKIDPKGPLHYTNIDFIIKFTKGPDFLDFFRVTVQTELCAVPGIKACVDALKAVLADDEETVVKSLAVIKQAVLDIDKCFDMFKIVDPDYFYFIMGPLATGWGGEHSVLPDGLIYEGISNEPQTAFSANAGQSPFVFLVDSTLGITHSQEAKPHIDDVMTYMPYYHREFIHGIRKGPSLKDYVAKKNSPELTAAYNSAVEGLIQFRSSHIRLVTRHMVLPSKKTEKIASSQQVAAQAVEIPGAMQYLKGIRDHTATQQLPTGL